MGQNEPFEFGLKALTRLTHGLASLKPARLGAILLKSWVKMWFLDISGREVGMRAESPDKAYARASCAEARAMMASLKPARWSNSRSESLIP